MFLTALCSIPQNAPSIQIQRHNLLLRASSLSQRFWPVRTRHIFFMFLRGGSAPAYLYKVLVSMIKTLCISHYLCLDSSETLGF